MHIKGREPTKIIANARSRYRASWKCQEQADFEQEENEFGFFSLININCCCNGSRHHRKCSRVRHQVNTASWYHWMLIFSTITRWRTPRACLKVSRSDEIAINSCFPHAQGSIGWKFEFPIQIPSRWTSPACKKVIIRVPAVNANWARSMPLLLEELNVCPVIFLLKAAPRVTQS